MGIFKYEDVSKDTMEQYKFTSLNYRSINVRDHNGVK